MCPEGGAAGGGRCVVEAGAGDLRREVLERSTDESNVAKLQREMHTFYVVDVEKTCTLPSLKVLSKKKRKLVDENPQTIEGQAQAGQTKYFLCTRFSGASMKSCGLDLTRPLGDGGKVARKG